MSDIGSDPLIPKNGGTGIANLNSSKITLGGALTTIGAFTSSFTMTGNTAVTFPTSGTLATTSQLPSLPLSGANGGTGVANTGSTITIGGNVAFSGAFTFTGTVTGNTAVTFPTSGTLATTSQLPTLPLSLAQGGMNANLTASNGGVFYSTATAGAILSGTATANQVLLSGASTTPAWSTATYPATTTLNSILYSSSASVVGQIPVVIDGVLISSHATGIPSFLANSGTPGWVLTAQSGAPPAWAAPSSTLATLSDDVSTTISPSAGNIQLVGHIVEQGATKFSTVVGGSSLANINPMSVARWIVDPLGFNGTHTTIASAITSATSGDTILLLPGTYTENLTLKAGVNITAQTGDCLTPTVTIVGKATMTTAGTVTISNIKLTTNSDFFLAVTGSAASIVNLQNCYLNASNNTGISFTSSNGGALINAYECLGDIGTTGISMFASSSAGGMLWRRVRITNSGTSTTASTMSAGSYDFTYCEFAFVISTSGNSMGMSIFYTLFNTGGLNTASVTHNCTASASTIERCRLDGGTASALSIGASAAINLFNCHVNSSNTNAITGSGTLNYTLVNFTGGSSTINTSTQNPTALTSQQGGTGVNNSGLTITLSSGGTGKVLTSDSSGNGTWAAAAGGSITITGNTGGGLTGSSFTFSGGTTGLSFGGSGTTETLSGTVVIANGGTNATSFGTSHGIVVYDGTRLVNYAGPQISTAGVQTNTAQPAFHAYNTTSQANVTGDGTIYTIIFDTALFDQASNFNTGSGTFTAPVTGKYQFNMNIGLNTLGAAHTLATYRLSTTANDFFFSYCNPGTVGAGASNGVFITSGSVIVPMTAGDTAVIKAAVYNSTKTVTVYGALGTCDFSGFLVC